MYEIYVKKRLVFLEEKKKKWLTLGLQPLCLHFSLHYQCEIIWTST